MARTRTSTTSSPRPLKLPRSIEIAGCQIAIRVSRLQETYGQFTFDDRLIEIDRDHLRDDPAEALNTLRHEMMEAALLLTGVGFMEKYDQEPVVRAMEQVFFPAWEKLRAKLGL